MYNRKLLCSVFNAQEAREAVLGGARIIDSEDPKSALGNIKPRHIMAVSDAVLDAKRDLEVQLSTNIGEDQLLFRRSETGEAIEKSAYEIAGKAAQAAIGVACSMGTRVHPTNLVKIGVDGMEVDKLRDVMAEVVLTLQRTEQFSHCQVMGVLFAQDLKIWNGRKRNEDVRKVLVELREFYPCENESDPLAFDLQQYAVGTLRDQNGRPMFADQSQVSLGALIQRGALPSGVNSSFVRTNELFAHAKYFPRLAQGDRTNRAVIKAMVDATADAGGNGIMIDTSILSKVCNICLVDTRGSELIDINQHVIRNNMVQSGILNLDDIRYFVEYCHYRGIYANVAGSIESYQAQQLWAMIEELDQCSSRGAASAVEQDPSKPENSGLDTRQHRVIKRTLVRGLTPPEHGGVLNIPVTMRDNAEAMHDVRRLQEKLRAAREDHGWPPLITNYVDSFGRVQLTE